MRKLNRYTAIEYLKLSPLKDVLKQCRNDIWQFFFCLKKPEGFESFLQEQEFLKGKNIAIIIAFEQPWALSWLLTMAVINQPDFHFIVFDNSQFQDKRSELKHIHSKKYLIVSFSFLIYLNFLEKKLFFIFSALPILLINE